MISYFFFKQPSVDEHTVFSFLVIAGASNVRIFKTCQTVASISMIRQFHEFLVLNFWRDFTIWSNCASQHRTQSVKSGAAQIIDRLWCTWFPLALSAQGRRQEPARPPECMRTWGLVFAMIIYVHIPIRLCLTHKLVLNKNFDVPAALSSRHAQW